MVLADLGAQVTLVDRPAAAAEYTTQQKILNRGKRSIAVDLKHPDGQKIVLRMLEEADILIEGFRPGVAERLGVGPEDALEHNQSLVYGRVTGWGQEGPLSQTAGHDINYIALAGALQAIGPTEQPVVPLNLIADYGGGAMLLVSGVLAALISARSTGKGQVVDAAMVDGTLLLMTIMHAGVAEGWWNPRRGSNFLDGSTPFYDVYRTADDRWVAVGSLEEDFFEELCTRLEIDLGGLPHRYDPRGWPELRRRLAQAFAQKTRDEWTEHFESGDACVTPVLDLTEATRHPHLEARGAFADLDGHPTPAPAPRFSHTPTGPPSAVPFRGEHTDIILNHLGFPTGDIDKLRRDGVVN